MTTEINSIKKLEDIVRSMPHTDYATLDFRFHPNVVTDYGVGAQWAASIRGSKIETVDYGWTLQQAVERLLDRVLYPEKYPEGDD